VQVIDEAVQVINEAVQVINEAVQGPWQVGHHLFVFLRLGPLLIRISTASVAGSLAAAAGSTTPAPGHVGASQHERNITQHSIAHVALLPAWQPPTGHLSCQPPIVPADFSRGKHYMLKQHLDRQGW
jgi:hypothetical protein